MEIKTSQGATGTASKEIAHCAIASTQRQDTALVALTYGC
jgi:hypothetical protein